MSFGTILVPLDGSELSDRILEQARRILVTQDAAVVLLQVIAPRAEKEPARAHQERRDAAQAHLDRLRRALNARGCAARAELLEDEDPAHAILEVAERVGAGLVTMTTHGRTGPARWVRGSVAERVLRGCELPLLLVNPKAMADAPSSPGDLRFRRLLVPLDGSARSAAVLPLVADVARAFEAPVTLLRVGWVAPAAMDYPLANPLLPVTVEELKGALDDAREELAEAGVTVDLAVAYGDVAHEILAEAERVPDTLLVLASHGRTGSDRWLFGSTAENVVRTCASPVLVQRVAALRREAQPASSSAADGKVTS